MDIDEKSPRSIEDSMFSTGDEEFSSFSVSLTDLDNEWFGMNNKTEKQDGTFWTKFWYQ